MAKHLRSDSVVRQLAHLVPRLYNKLLPVPCFLCGVETADGPLCADCMADLPEISHQCPLCAIPLQSDTICGDCLKKPPPQQKSISLFTYQEPVDRCISAFKYHRHLGFASLFADLLAKKVQHDYPLATLVPVPLHPIKIRFRGFNQSQEIAKRLSHHLSLPLNPHCLVRSRNTPAQSQLTAKARRQNIRNAFSCNGPSPDSVILIDDVLTSGCTVREAAATLQKAGCQRIEVWTIARAISHY